MKANTTIANRGCAAETATRPPVERAWVYQPETAWFYSHHPSQAFFKGRYYVIWSNGRRDENAPGQHGDQVLTAAGFHQHDGLLVAYAGSYEYHPECLDENGQRRPGDKGHMNTTLLAVTRRDGVTWSGPTDRGLPIVPGYCINPPPEPFNLWNYRGAFGVLDSGRADVAYEDWHGHKLDRRLLDLLQQF